jgi:hypothetical protein
MQQANCTRPRYFSNFFSYRVNNFLNLLCHEFVRSTATHRLLLFTLWCLLFPHHYDGCVVCTFFSQPQVLFLHHNSIPYQDIGSVVSTFLIGLLITMLSNVSMDTTTTSCVLAAVITVNNGIPFLSVSTCLLVPILSLPAGLQPLLSP